MRRHFVLLRAAMLLGIAAAPAWAQSPFTQSTKNLLVTNGVLSPSDRYVSISTLAGLSANYELLLPTSAPSANQVLSVKAVSGTEDTLTWITPVTGGGTATQVAFWSGTVGAASTVLSSSSNLFWDNVKNSLGIGTGTTVNTQLDVTADFATREFNYTGTLATSNNDVSFDGATPANQTSLVRIASQAAAYTLTGIAGGQNGKHMIVTNVSGQTMTLANQSVNSAAANRIVTGTGVGLAIPTNGTAILHYSNQDSRWYVDAFNNGNTGGEEGGNAWLLQGNGGTNPTENFLGTTDPEPLVVKTNGTEAMRVSTSNLITLGVQGGGTSAPPASFTIGSAGWMSASSSSNQAGTDLVIQSGPATGNSATNANIIFETPTVGASGTTVQSLAERMRVENSNLVTLGAQGSGGTAPPSSFTFGAAGYVAASSGSNQTGTDLVIASGPNTGNSTAAGNVIFQTPTAGSSGSAAQALAERMRIEPGGNVGINTTSPNVTLDIHGGWETREDTISLSNGTNNNVNIGNATYVMIVGPTSAFTITGIANGVDGKRIRLVNLTDQNMTIADSSTSSSAGNRILTGATGDISLFGPQQVIDFIYDSRSSQWLISNLNNALAVGAVGSVRLSSKPSDQTVTSNANLVADNDLSVSIGRYQVWEMNAELQADNTSNNVDVRIAFSIPAGATMKLFFTGVAAAGGNAIEGADILSTSGVTGAQTGSKVVTILAGKSSLISVRGIVTSGSTSGSLALDWSQGTANNSGTIMRSGSYMKITRIQ